MFTTPSIGPSGLTPQQMQRAYGLDQVSFSGITGNGAGQTIALIQADHSDPDALEDLEQFDTAYSLPNPPRFERYFQDGTLGGWNPGTAEPAGEESLDIQWAHAMAPYASIDVIECDSYADFSQGVITAANLPGVSVVSMSYEVGADYGDNSAYTTPAGHPPVTFVASSGDNGAFLNGVPDNWPASSPNVVGVGGTVLTTNGSSGAPSTETGWGNSGGGISSELQPTYQNNRVNGISSAYRLVPDVAMDAGDYPGNIAIVDSVDYPTFFNGLPDDWVGVTGTSLSCPLFAGIIAVADQGRAIAGLQPLDGPSQTVPRLYGLPAPDFHDITSGNNATEYNTETGYSAGPGYDLVTGLGSPVGNLLVPDLAFQASDFTPSDFIVTNTSDSGTGSLRQAIIDSNLYYQGTGQSENISFNIPTNDPDYSNGAFTIKPQTPLPTITEPNLTIDGRTETENNSSITNPSGGPVIYLDGANNSFAGLTLAASGDVIANLGVDRFAGMALSDGGILLTGDATHCTVKGCYIGIAPNGTSSAGNGIGISTAGEVIGGNSINAGIGQTSYDVFGFNTIGIVLDGSGDTVDLADIGVAPISGTTYVSGSYPNGTGVEITGSNNTIENSKIGNSTGSGITIIGSSATNELIEGSAIGVAPSLAGESPAANGSDGILIQNGAADEQIESDVISGNTDNGIEISGGEQNEVFSCNIGDTDYYVGGKYVYDSNGQNGLLIENASTSNEVGGLALSTGNTIAGNGGDGVDIADSASTHNSIGFDYIGTDSAGDSIGNQFGIFSLGNDEAFEDDTISGNTSDGIEITGSSNTIGYNKIGVNPTGTAALPNQLDGVLIASGTANTVNENTISGNVLFGVVIASSSNRISGNSIGLNAAYTAAIPNKLDGVLVTGASNIISGDVISGNRLVGIALEANNNTVAYCYVGVNTSGGAVSNGAEGIYIDSSGNLIGGSSFATAGNVISGNTNGNGYGILLDTASAAANYIQGNYIGTNLTGTAAVANTDGIVIQNNATGNFVGNSSTSVGNVISGNTNDGIYIVSTAGASNLITTNFIGTTAAGTAAVANGIGVYVAASTNNVMVSANVISYNNQGGISCFGNATVTNDTINSNTASTYGGGIDNTGAITVVNTSFSGDSAPDGAGGLYNGGTANVSGCTFYELSGNLFGGAIDNGSTLSIINSTFNDNAASDGGAIYNTAGLTVEDSTIDGNSGYYGGGVDNQGTLTLENTIVAADTASTGLGGGGTDIGGAVASGSSYNLIGSNNGLTGITNGLNNNQIGTAAVPINPQLGSLANNGGYTQTMLPANNSPVLNTGIGINSLSTDQRGGSRPTSGAVDIGAVQLQGIHVTISNAAIYLRLASDGQTLDIYYNNTGTGTPAATYVLANLASLIASSTSGNGQLTVDFSNGAPVPSGSAFTYNATGGGNTLKVIGSAGNDTISINPGNASVGISSFTYTGVGTRVVDPLAGSDSLSIGSTVTVSFPVAPAGGGIVTHNLSSLSLGMAAHLVVPTASARTTDRTLLIIQSATLGAAAAIDLGGNDADFTTTPLNTVNDWLTTGYAGGNWSGTGINSSIASDDSTHLTALGVMQNNQAGSAIFSSSNPFDNTTPGPADVLVKYTYYGDANLDGKVDGSDYSRIDNGYLDHLTGWMNGDFNYDTAIDGSDYTLVDNAFNTQGASLTAANASAVAVPMAPSVAQLVSDQNLAIRATRMINLRTTRDLATTELSAPNIFNTQILITVPGATEQSIECASLTKDVLDQLILTARIM